MPKVTDAHLEARRQQILEAAAACFAQRGFHQTTMHHICQQAELSPGAVYRYFPGKEDIIAAMVSERRREGIAMIRAVVQEQNETLAVLDKLADLFFSKLEDTQGCAVDIELWAEAMSNPRVKELIRLDLCEVQDAFADILRAAQERGEVNTALDARAIAQVMVSFFDGLVLQKSLDPSVDVWPYVTVIKAMMGGAFWVQEKAEGGS